MPLLTIYKSLIVLSVTTAHISVASFAAVIKVPVGIASARNCGETVKCNNK